MTNITPRGGGIKDELQALYDEYVNLEQGDYTDDSWSVLQTALLNAKAVLDDENAYQKDIDNAIKELESAIDGLDYIVSISASTTRTNYEIGEEIDKSTISVERIYHSGKTETLLEDEFEIDPATAPTELGNFEITVTADGFIAVINVTVDLKPLAECTPSEVQAIAQSGRAEECWSVGDSIGITLNGTVGILDFDNETWYADIIGFNHNKDLETEGLPNVAFQFGSTEDSTRIAFIDSNFGSDEHAEGFVMNTSVSNSGGWESSYMRNTICQQFLEAMPTEWQNIIKPTIKYTDNVGNGTGTIESNITATEDKIFLLGYYETSGSDSTYANSYEANYTEPYTDYYKDDDDRVRHEHSEVESACRWWNRSPYNNDNAGATNSTRGFCSVGSSGHNGVASYGASASYGFAPAFTIF